MKALIAHDKAYKTFIKQKEAYDRVEAQLRSRREHYEATKLHAEAQAAMVEEKVLEVNDMKAQKENDDVSRVCVCTWGAWSGLTRATWVFDTQRERELRLMALKNPGAN